jgi:hypothetical protein
MLVTFDSKVGRVTMFGDVAGQLIRMMGHSGAVPGALLAEEIPRALANLKRALADADQPPAPSATQEEDSQEKTAAPISLRTRGYPLIQLLENALEQSADVLWDQDGSAVLKF